MDLGASGGRRLERLPGCACHKSLNMWRFKNHVRECWPLAPHGRALPLHRGRTSPRPREMHALVHELESEVGRGLVGREGGWVWQWRGGQRWGLHLPLPLLLGWEVLQHFVEGHWDRGMLRPCCLDEQLGTWSVILLQGAGTKEHCARLAGGVCDAIALMHEPIPVHGLAGRSRLLHVCCQALRLLQGGPAPIRVLALRQP